MVFLDKISYDVTSRFIHFDAQINSSIVWAINSQQEAILEQFEQNVLKKPTRKKQQKFAA